MFIGLLQKQAMIIKVCSCALSPLKSLLNKIYSVRRCDQLIRKIDYDLATASVQSLLTNISVDSCTDLLEEDSLSKSISDSDGKSTELSESYLEVEFAEVIQEFYEKLKQDPEFKCWG